jgi:mevalonate kinase
MMLGEHAVLHGRRAVACAVDRRITITARPRTDGQLTIESALGTLAAPMREADARGTFRFTTAVAATHAHALPHGAALQIETAFSHEVGLGSSAAVTVATAAALHALAGTTPTADALLDEGLAAVRAVQGAGSGTDLAAAIAGGVVVYRIAPRLWKPLPHHPAITLLYSGSKTPTPEVIAIVERGRQADPLRFEALFDAIDASIDEAQDAFLHRDWAALGHVLRRNQQYMRGLGVSNPALEEIVATLQAQPGIHGAKISGSGLGDCVLGIGRADLRQCAYEPIPVAIAPAGVTVD